MSLKSIGGIYKIFGNQNEEKLNRSLTVKWSKETAKLKETVRIEGKITGKIGRERVLVFILFNGNKFAQARNIVMHGDTITAEWDVESIHRGDFDGEAFYAEIQYGETSGTTQKPLIIERLGGNQNASNFIRVNTGKAKGPNLSGY